MTMGTQNPVITEKTLATSGCRKFQLDVMGEHLCTCTTHSSAKEDHDWAVEQLSDLFHTTHKVKTQHVTKYRGRHLQNPNDIDKSLNETTTDKIRKYHTDYNNNPPSTVSFMSDIASTSGRLHSEFIRLLFIQSHRETDRFFAVSGVQLV
jgi:hypothetical protein